ncbi:hypothetical protein FKM82_020816 [Ascaphus truei]
MRNMLSMYFQVFFLALCTGLYNCVQFDSTAKACSRAMHFLGLCTALIVRAPLLGAFLVIIHLTKICVCVCIYYLHAKRCRQCEAERKETLDPLPLMSH